MKPFFCLYRIVLHFSCLTFPNWCSFHTLATRWQQWRALTSQLFKTFSHFLFLFMWWRDVRGAGTSSMLRIQFLMLSKDFSLVMSYTSMMPCNIKTGNDLSTGSEHMNCSSCCSLMKHTQQITWQQTTHRFTAVIILQYYSITVRTQSVTLRSRVHITSHFSTHRHMIKSTYSTCKSARWEWFIL